MRHCFLVLLLGVGSGCSDSPEDGGVDATGSPDVAIGVDATTPADRGRPADGAPGADAEVPVSDGGADVAGIDSTLPADAGAGLDTSTGDGSGLADAGGPLAVGCTRNGVAYTDTLRPLPASKADWGTIATPIPDSAYDWNSDIVLDKQTCLIWKRTIENGLHTWSDANAQCSGLSFAGHSDWRLPTRAELESLQDKSKRASPYCNASAFPNLSNWFWSSTSIPSTQFAYIVGFGATNKLAYPKTNKYWVVCAR